MATPGQYLPDLVVHDLQGGMIADQMMQQYQQQPTLLAGIAGDRKSQQRRLTEVDSIAARVETLRKLFMRRAVAVQHDLGDDQGSPPPNHLRRSGQAIPRNGRPENVVTIDHPLNGSEIAVEQVAACKRHLADQQIWIALRR